MGDEDVVDEMSCTTDHDEKRVVAVDVLLAAADVENRRGHSSTWGTSCDRCVAARGRPDGPLSPCRVRV